MEKFSHFELSEKESIQLKINGLQRITFVLGENQPIIENHDTVSFFNILERCEGASTIYCLPDESVTVVFVGPGTIYKALD